MTRFMTILSAIFSASAGVIILSFLGTIVLATYNCVQAPPQTLEEECREWAKSKLDTCQAVAYRNFDDEEEGRAVAECYKTHVISELMKQCMATEAQND